MNPSIASLASALHEIRTPIQTILGMAELLKTTRLDSEQQEYVRQIAFCADVIYTLANDILDFERLRTGSLRLERIEFNPTDLIEQALNIVSIEAYSKGVELLSDIDRQVPQKLHGDSLRLHQVLLNMVKNAVKFTDEGYILIRVRLDGSGSLLFEVIDSGVGVPEDKKERIFHAFAQASDSTTRQYGGSGLGLSICSQLVRLMGGTLGVQDNPEGGSIFFFTLPLDKDQQGEGLPLDRAGREDEPSALLFPPGSRILVVDDSPQYLDNISRIISRLSNLQVVCAPSGAEALALMRSAAEQGRNFLLVLMDLGMPAMDGWRLAAEINKDPSINGAKLYLMVPEGQLRDEAKMKLLSWFNGYLYKPVVRTKLQELLAQALAQPLELPAVERASPESGVGALSAPLAGLGPILAVDDHPVNLKILTTFLTSLGAVAHGAESGEQAISLVQQHPEIRIVFMDIEMPLMNGFETSRRIRELGFKGVIVACSANSVPDLIQDYIQAGINDYLAKPFKKQQLADLLRKWQETDAQDIDGRWDGPR